MTDERVEEVWKSYQDAWADIPHAERERLLRRSVTEDVSFTSVAGKGQGIEELIPHIEQFQTQFPGASFRSKQLIVQNGQLFSLWTMYGKDNAELLTGYSYARLNEHEHLTHLAGFWKQ